MRSTLPFGDTQFSVRSTEAASPEGRPSVLVHVIMNLESSSQARVASQSWHQWFKLVDQDQKSYRCRYILPTDYYFHNLGEKRHAVESWAHSWNDERPSTQTPTEWVLLFDTDRDAHGFTLRIDNSTFGSSGQPLSLSVPLDQ